AVDASTSDGGRDAGAMDAGTPLDSAADAHDADLSDGGGVDADADVADAGDDSAIGDADLADADDASVDTDAGSMCPSNGTPCGDCVAAACCAQVGACLADPACAAAFECELTCTKMGGQPIQCFQQCGGNPGSLNALTCVANNCGAGVCL